MPLLDALREPCEIALGLATRIRLYAIALGLVLASVPFVHLFVDVELGPFELAIHSLDIALGSAVALGLVELTLSAWQRGFEWRIRGSRASLAGGLATAMAVAFGLQALAQDWLPHAEEIRSRHVSAGYTDMSLRVLPLIALIGWLVAQSFRRGQLERELRALRALEPRLAGAAPAPPTDPPLVVRHEGRERALRPDAIARVQAEQNYCRIVFAEPERADWLVRTTFADVLAALPEGRFVRTHRSHAVALEQVADLAGRGRGAELRLRSGDAVPISRARIGPIRDLLLRRLDEASC